MTPRHAHARFRPNFELLEAREVPSVSVSLSGTTLRIDGQSTNDYAKVVPSGSNLVVTYYTIGQSSQQRTYSAASVARVEFRGNGGNDQLITDASSKPTYMSGGDGNDYLEAADARDSVYGGNGNDTLYGYAGDDYLNGGAGIDRLNGGDGNDSCYGGSGTDSCYGGNGNDRLYGEAGEDWIQGDAGVDFFDGGTEWDRFKDSFVEAVDGYTVSDIQQRESGVCTILATIGATAGYLVDGRSWDQRVEYVDSTHYRVLLYRNNVAYWETVDFAGWWSDDDTEPRRNSAGTTYEAWVVVVQRTVLDNYNIPWATQYADAWENYGGDWQHSTRAHSAIVGDAPAYVAVANSDAAAQALDTRLNSYFVVAESESSGSATYISSSTIVGSHAYAVMDVYKSGSTWYVQVYNPWGSDDYSSNGYQTLTWAEFYYAFAGYVY